MLRLLYVLTPLPPLLLHPELSYSQRRGLGERRHRHRGPLCPRLLLPPVHVLLQPPLP